MCFSRLFLALAVGLALSIPGAHAVPNPNSALTPAVPAPVGTAAPTPVAPGPAAPSTPVAPESSAPKLEVLDQRPDAETKTRALSSWIFSCNFGVEILGDEIAPDRIDRLKAALTAKLGARLAGAHVTIDHYGLYLNAWAETVGGVYAETRWPKCEREKMTGGWFNSAELTTPYSPFVVEMEVHVDGRRYLVHSVFSPPKNMPAFGGAQSGDYLGEGVAARIALDRANANLIAQLSGAHP